MVNCIKNFSPVYKNLTNSSTLFLSECVTNVTAAKRISPPMDYFKYVWLSITNDSPQSL